MAFQDQLSRDADSSLDYRRLVQQLAVAKARSSAVPWARAVDAGVTSVADPNHPYIQFNYTAIDESPILDKRERPYIVRRYLLAPEDNILPPLDTEKSAPGLPVYQRFWAPAGVPSPIYWVHGLLPTPLLQLVTGAPTRIYFVEGQLKAIAGCLSGLLMAGFSGVWNWKSKKHHIRLLADLRALVERGHTFIIVWDSDVRTNPEVQNARIRFREALREAGCPDHRIKVVTLPNGPPDADGEPTKLGFDDLAARSSLAAARAYLEEHEEQADEADPPSKVTYRMVTEAVRDRWDFRTSALGAGALEYNEAKQMVEIDRRAVKLESAVSKMRERANIQFGVRYNFGKEDVQDALYAVAREKPYHPVRDYFLKLRPGEPGAIADLARRMLAEPDSLDGVLLRKTLIAAVARAMQPGCKVDTVFTLMGAQGWFKSTVFRVLAGEEYFSDTVVDLKNKDALLGLVTTWFTEWPELATKHRGGLKPGEYKAFISSPVDNVRPPYGRATERVPRWGIIVASTNEEEFLDDPTGARRFWPARARQMTPDDVAAITVARDSIWTEAFAAWKASEPWWLGPDGEVELRERQGQHQVKDALTERVLDAVESFQPAGASTDDIMKHVYEETNTPWLGRQDLFQRVKNILRVNGYEWKRWTLDGERQAHERWRRADWSGTARRGNPNMKKRKF
jgi:hypothetical protein